MGSRASKKLAEATDIVSPPQELWRTLGCPSLLAFVGGGGKTTLAFRVAQQASAANCRTVVTTTTRMLMPTKADGFDAIILEDTLSSAQQRLRDIFSAGALRVFLATGSESSSHGQRAVGIPTDWAPELYSGGLADVVVVEADGSRKLPFKAPQVPREPALPVGVTVVAAVVGIDCLGMPLLEDHVCRADEVAALAGVESGCLVTPDIIGRVLGDRNVWCHDAALEAAQVSNCIPQFYAVVNKVDNSEASEHAGAVIAALRRQGRGLGGILVTGDAGGVDGRGTVFQEMQLELDLDLDGDDWWSYGGGHINEAVIAEALSHDCGIRGCGCSMRAEKQRFPEGMALSDYSDTDDSIDYEKLMQKF